jgi:hypothetical protein
MGKRRKSGKSARPKLSDLPDAVSDNEEGDVIGTNLHGDEVDDFYDAGKKAASLKYICNGISRLWIQPKFYA